MPNNFNLNMHTLPLSGSIHQQTLPAEGLQVYALQPRKIELDQHRSRTLLVAFKSTEKKQYTLSPFTSRCVADVTGSSSLL